MIPQDAFRQLLLPSGLAKNLGYTKADIARLPEPPDYNTAEVVAAQREAFEAGAHWGIEVAGPERTDRDIPTDEDVADETARRYPVDP
jgi:hypothetical protein